MGNRVWSNGFQVLHFHTVNSISPLLSQPSSSAVKDNANLSETDFIHEWFHASGIHHLLLGIAAWRRQHANTNYTHTTWHDSHAKKLTVASLIWLVACTLALHVNKTETTKKQPFNSLFSRTTWVSRYQKGKTNLDFTGAIDSEWQWHQLGHMQVCTSLQTDNHAITPPLSFFTGRMPFLPPNQ